MYCGTIPCNKETDLGHLANIVFVYNQLDGRFDFNKHYIMGNLEIFLDRMSKRILNNNGAEYMDLCHRELNPNDDGLSTYVHAYDSVPVDEKLWTLECIVGWCIHDAFVTYLHSTNTTDIAFELYVLKNEWGNACREDTIRSMRTTVDKYNELLARENSRFYLESGEVYN